MRESGARFAPPYRQGTWSGNSWTPTPNASEWAPPTYAPPFSPANPFGDRTYEFVFWAVNGSDSIGGFYSTIDDDPLLPPITLGGRPWTLSRMAQQTRIVEVWDLSRIQRTKM